MELDARMLLTAAGMLVSVVSAAAIVRQRLATTIEQLQDVEKRLRVMDTRIDKAELTEQKVAVLAGMLSPSERDKAAREIATIVADTKQALDRIKHLETMHNTKHPIVASERKAT